MRKIISIYLLCLGLIFSAPLFATSILQSMTDSTNSGIINTKMYTDNSLSNIHVDATVTNGIAIFRGTVYSKAQLNELIRIARSVSGIHGVDVSRIAVVNR